MKKMMDIREKILKELDQKPGEAFSVSTIARTIGSSNKAINSALGKLFRAGLVVRPQRGAYSSKRRPSHTTAAPKPAQAIKPVATKPVAAKPAQAAPAPGVSLSVITIDLLVEGEASKIDTSGLLEKVRGNKGVLDARVSKVIEADQSKLQVRFAFADEK